MLLWQRRSPKWLGLAAAAGVERAGLAGAKLSWTQSAAPLEGERERRARGGGRKGEESATRGGVHGGGEGAQLED